jgi:hypothetical protein
MALALAVTACFGCQDTSDRGLLQEAESLLLNAQWEPAIPLLKQHLLSYPDDAGAHFYLGRCYLNAESDVPMMVFALGELETALHLFKERGQPNTIERFSDTYFELICHLERTKVYLKQADFVLMQAEISPHIRREILEGILDRCDEALATARGLEPGSPDVRNLEGILRRLRQNLGLPRGARRQLTPSSAQVG